MRLEKHVFHAIDDFNAGKIESALMHACTAIDGSAKKFYPKGVGGAQEYKSFLREHWWIIERFIGDGLNLEETKFSYLTLDNGRGKNIPNPDLADIIYHIFRCNHAHAEEVPIAFELMPYDDGYYKWKMDMVNGHLQMPESIVWALLGVAVFTKANADIQTDNGYFLTWGSQTLGLGPEIFPIKEWWGRYDDVKIVLSKYPHTRVKTVF